VYVPAWASVTWPLAGSGVFADASMNPVPQNPLPCSVGVRDAGGAAGESLG
jgi:hypothetical protein